MPSKEFIDVIPLKKNFIHSWAFSSFFRASKKKLLSHLVEFEIPRSPTDEYLKQISLPSNQLEEQIATEYQANFMTGRTCKDHPVSKKKNKKNSNKLKTFFGKKFKKILPHIVGVEDSYIPQEEMNSDLPSKKKQKKRRTDKKDTKFERRVIKGNIANISKEQKKH